MCKIAMQSSQVDLLEKRVKLSMYSLKSDAVGTTVKRGGGGGREGGGEGEGGREVGYGGMLL